MIPATTSRHRAAVHTRSLNRLWYDGTVLFYNRSGEKYSATGILEVLNEYFEVRIFIPSEYGDGARQELSKYGISPEQIVTLPLNRRQVLVRNLLGIRVPGLEIGKKDWVWTPNERILSTLEKQACIVHDLMPMTAAKYFPIAQKIMHRVFFSTLTEQPMFDFLPFKYGKTRPYLSRWYRRAAYSCRAVRITREW